MEEKRELGLDEMKKVSGGAWSEDGEEYSRVYMYPCPFCDEEFADHNKGWALVLVDGERCSTQGIVTQCTLYEQYTTQEALLAAAKSHSNRKMKIELPSDLF